MKASLSRIENKPEDFKLCEDCYNINWYEKDECNVCGSDNFSNTKTEDIIEWVNVYKIHWREIEKYEEEEINNVEIEI